LTCLWFYDEEINDQAPVLIGMFLCFRVWFYWQILWSSRFIVAEILIFQGIIEWSSPCPSNLPHRSEDGAAEEMSIHIPYHSVCCKLSHSSPFFNPDLIDTRPSVTWLHLPVYFSRLIFIITGSPISMLYSGQNTFKFRKKSHIIVPWDLFPFFFLLFSQSQNHPPSLFAWLLCELQLLVWLYSQDALLEHPKSSLDASPSCFHRTQASYILTCITWLHNDAFTCQ
jgi:hypothetical protein